MNRQPNPHRASMPNHRISRRAALVPAFVLFASLAGASLAHAASFRCPHNASASERLVCSDPQLSALDDKLAALYRSAVEATPDTTALEADRISQWQWRQHNCKDKACVADWYDRRIAELQGDLQHGKQASAERVRTGVVDQQLAPTAQDAVLEMKGITCENPNAAAKAEAQPDSKLHLHKMPSGVAADARQKHLAEAAAAHGAAPAAVSAPAATAAATATATTAATTTAAAATPTPPQTPLQAQTQEGAVTVR
ncbi:lysozyme inhibitor LprI family protein [Paraburkholderia sp. B3]|uniref:lysozyme inhibitor LprI family protein n=1 Tax=Paraburkholderia sp. B3 TaxID=3134791 RepID=UPI003981E151